MDERRMSAALAQLATTLTSAFSIQALLDQLVIQVVEVLGVSGAGVLLMQDSTHHRFVAATDDLIRSLESTQLERGEGPCLVAFTTGEHVAVPDLAADEEFTLFSPAAVRAGLGGVYSFPLRLDHERLGALEVYSKQPLVLSPRDLEAAQTLADVAAAYLFNAEARRLADESAAELAAKVMRDPLTGLPNRAELQQRMDGVMTRSRESQTFAGVLFIDIDRFKQVNDTYGHPFGDAVLVEFVRRVLPLVPAGGLLARLAGDEFVLLCESLSDQSDAEQVAARILAALEPAFNTGAVTVAVRASIGIAYAGHRRVTPDAALMHADAAMYRAKAQGGARSYTATTLDSLTTNPRRPVERDLAAGIDSDALYLVYQPILDAATTRPVGVEALLRWQHPQLGALGPLEIITAAQRVGLTTRLSGWVLRQVVRDIQRWDHMLGGAAPAFAGVNLAYRELLQPDVVALVAQVLTEGGVSPSRLCMEITEDVFLADDSEAATHLGTLGQMGLGVALDGFGDGFSSLVDLKNLPVTTVKIGRSFVAGVADSEVDQAIVSAVVQLGRALGLTVVAEGVETDAQLACLRGLGCHQVQGILLSPPLETGTLETFLA